MKTGMKQGGVKFFSSDEFTIRQFVQRKRTVCTRVETRFHDCYTQATVKHLLSIMIWGSCLIMTQLIFSLCQWEQQ